MRQQTKQNQRLRRHQRVRARVRGTQARPRLCVFRSHRHLEAQLIDDVTGHTLVAARDRDVAHKKTSAGRQEQAAALGVLIAERAYAKHINRVVFDRGGYAYHGMVKAIAEGARKGGLQL